MRSVLQDWVMELGLRHQGCLLSIVRGCDTAPKGDVTKRLLWQIRGVLLNPHCEDILQAKTFMEAFSRFKFRSLAREFTRNHDHYPHHFIMHLMHACEVIGYKHPLPGVKEFFEDLCDSMHVNPEAEVMMDIRLNAPEEQFAQTAYCSTLPEGNPVGGEVELGESKPCSLGRQA